MRLRLHSYWRSTAAYRVRIALGLKGLPFDTACVELRQGEHRREPYRTMNPQGLVPTLEADGKVLTQSTAILEWLEEVYPEPRLLPADPFGRAHVRATAAIVAADIHPLNNLRVLERLRRVILASEPAVSDWIAHWIEEGFSAVEPRLATRGWAFGDQPGFADCFIVPQVYSARRFGVDLKAYPRIQRIERMAAEHPAFVAAQPDRQIDADRIVA